MGQEVVVFFFGNLVFDGMVVCEQGLIDRIVFEIRVDFSVFRDQLSFDQLGSAVGACVAVMQPFIQAILVETMSTQGFYQITVIDLRETDHTVTHFYDDKVNQF